MYFDDRRLLYPVRLETPDPLFAQQLQQCIGGIEGEIRVWLQYFLQAWGARGPTNKYRDMLLHTGTDEIGHIEMQATTVAMNLEDAPASLAETSASANPLVNAVIGGECPRHVVEGMELGGSAALPIPNSFDQSQENSKHPASTGVRPGRVRSAAATL